MQEHRHALAQLPCRIAAPVSDDEFSRSPWAPSWWHEWQQNPRSCSNTLPRFASRASAFAAAAAAEALADAGIDLDLLLREDRGGISPSRVSVSIGVGMPAVRAAALAGGELSAARGGSGAGAAGEGGLIGGGGGRPPLLSARTSRLLRDSALASGPSSLLADSLGLSGPLFAPSTACAAGASAVADAFEAVASGDADVAVAGGSEACVDAVTLAAFSRMRALCCDSNDGEGGEDGRAPWAASRPFGGGRSGFVVGEGAGVLVLEAAETAAARSRVKRSGGSGGRREAGTAYCELRGCGVSADAHHAAQPPAGGPGAARAMRRALKSSGLKAGDVQHVSAHATSTPAGDAAEAAALASVFSSSAEKGRRPLPVVSGVKAAIGHLLGAAGAVEAALAVAALADARAPPTATLATREEEAGGGETKTGRRSRVGVEEKGFEIARAVEGGFPLSSPSSSSSSPSPPGGPLVALSNSFGFGGANVCLAFSSPPGAAGLRARRWRDEDEGEGGERE